MAMQYNSMGDIFAELIPNQARSVLETSLFVVADKSIGLALLNLPVPPAPHVYDRKPRQFTCKNSSTNAYVDSLALMDRTFGQLRHSMESAGKWENTRLVVSSDHGYRQAQVPDGKKDSRIPFLTILRGELTTSDAVCHWLDGHRSHPAKP
jgi:arylsulfatase A-like enzyme